MSSTSRSAEKQQFPGKPFSALSVRNSSAFRFLLLGAAAFLLFPGVLVPAHAVAQGCAQCSETVGQTPARTQSAYRKGIVVLIVAATTLAAATTVIARRFR